MYSFAGLSRNGGWKLSWIFLRGFFKDSPWESPPLGEELFSLFPSIMAKQIRANQPLMRLIPALLRDY